MDELRNRVPLTAGSVLSDRFVVEELLGMGSFGAWYRAYDRTREFHVAIRELLPYQSSRIDGGFVDLGLTGPACSEIRRRFISHSKAFGKIRNPHLVGASMGFEKMGTAYTVQLLLDSPVSLMGLIERDGPIQPEELHRITEDLLVALHAVHGTLRHHDIRPTNLVRTRGEWMIIDPGSAREWEADRADSHELLFDARFAAPEVLMRHGHRSHRSDLYSLCASLFWASLPETDRLASDVDAYDLMAADRPDIPESLAQTISAGLSNGAHMRPQSASELLRILHGEPLQDKPSTLSDFDFKRHQLDRLTFQPRQCPSCRTGVLERPKPLKLSQCPVCQTGMIRKRTLNFDLCPLCRTGKLAKVANLLPDGVCPACATGLLAKVKKKFFGKSVTFQCRECDAAFEATDSGYRCDLDDSPLNGTTLTAEDWLQKTCRSRHMYCCSACGAQFDEADDGRRFQAVPKGMTSFGTMYIEQWARVAAGLPSEGGNAECDACGADYLLDEDSVTLLRIERDPYSWCHQFVNQRMSLDAMRWIGVGKSSLRPGYVCLECGTELDEADGALNLVRTNCPSLQKFASKTYQLGHWHRLGLGLPLPNEVEEFERAFQETILEAYQLGEIGLEHPKRPDLIWDSTASLLPAQEPDSDAEAEALQGKLTITDSELTFGGIFRRKRFDLGSFQEAEVRDEHLVLNLNGELLAFKLGPAEISLSLDSGNRKVPLQLQHLVTRLKRLAFS